MGAFFLRHSGPTPGKDSQYVFVELQGVPEHGCNRLAEEKVIY